jgi:hypothetical protein
MTEIFDSACLSCEVNGSGYMIISWDMPPDTELSDSSYSRQLHCDPQPMVRAFIYHRAAEPCEFRPGRFLSNEKLDRSVRDPMDIAFGLGSR